MKVFLQSIVAQILLNAYLYYRGQQAIPSDHKLARKGFAAFFLIEILLFFTGFFFHRTLPDPIYLFILKVCSAWYIALIYMGMIMISIDVLRFLYTRSSSLPKIPTKIYKRLKLSLLALIPTAAAIILPLAYRNATSPIVQSQSISIKKPIVGRDSLRIALVTDIHIGEQINRERVHHYVDFINAQNPDIILLGGDLLDYEVRYAEKQRAEEEIRRLSAPLGVYAVLGNHEYRTNRFAKLRWLERIGATLLVDSVVNHSAGFYLIGRDDAINRSRTTMQQLMHGIDRDKPIIVLEHQPNSIGEMIMNEVDLALYGHTHNGQLWPYPLLMKHVYPNAYGYKSWGNLHTVVSSGIGHAGPPFRVGTRSEIQMVTVFFE